MQFLDIFAMSSSSTQHKHLFNFLSDNLWHGFRKTWNISDEMLAEKTSALFADLSDMKKWLDKFEKEVADGQLDEDDVPELALNEIVLGYVIDSGRSDRSRQLMREMMLLAYLKDGGKTNWFQGNYNPDLVALYGLRKFLNMKD